MKTNNAIIIFIFLLYQFYSFNATAQSWTSLRESINENLKNFETDFKGLYEVSTAFEMGDGTTSYDPTVFPVGFEGGSIIITDATAEAVSAAFMVKFDKEDEFLSFQNILLKYFYRGGYSDINHSDEYDMFTDRFYKRTVFSGEKYNARVDVWEEMPALIWVTFTEN